MAAHPSFPAWRIPWTEEPAGSWSVGLQSWARLHDRQGTPVGATTRQSVMKAVSSPEATAQSGKVINVQIILFTFILYLKSLKHNERSITAVYSQGPLCPSAADCPPRGLLVPGAPDGGAGSLPAGPSACSFASCV